LLDKNLKVKQASPAELASARHDARTARESECFNRETLRMRREAKPPVPALIEPKGFSGYVRQLERASRLLAVDATELRDRAPAAKQPLGNNTESRAGFIESICEKTGEIQQLTPRNGSRELVPVISPEIASINARAGRFSAQSSAGRLLSQELTPRGTQWRVSGCIRRKVGSEVAVMYSPSIKKAHFGGLMVCGSVWTCPPCAAKVSERRKLEVVQATDLHKAQGGGLYMVTTTTSHKRTHDLADWLARFSDARARMRRQRRYRELVQEMGQLGSIRALEVTYGDANGWHPHEHGLWLTARPLSDAKLRVLRAELFTLWRRACLAAGLPLPNRARGVNIIVMESAADYVAKFGREPRWGIGSEMAKQHSKVGQAKSLTPFDLLRLYQQGSEDGSHKRFGALFVVFAKAFFGKRQIVWSDGLKEIFGIQQVTDEEISEDEADDAAELVRITASQWRCVLHQRFEVRQVLLQLAESGGHDAVVEYLDSLTSRVDYVPF